MFLRDLISNITILATCYFAFTLIKVLIRNTVYPLVFSKRKDIKKYGNWIVITGATDGIGKAFAEILAKDGYNLVLISRSDDRLQNVRSELMASYNVEIKLLKADFTKINIYESIQNCVAGLDVALLINNVGMSYPCPSYLTDDSISNELVSDILNCNCLSTVLVTKIILNAGMLKKGGFIVNISSGLGVVPSPFLSIYGASKSFINSFSLSLQSELKNSKVIMQNVAPWAVSTKMSKVKENLLAPSAISFADSVLNRLGTCSTTNGCMIHELQAWFVGMFPACVIERIMCTTMLHLRKKGLNKIDKNN